VLDVNKLIVSISDLWSDAGENVELESIGGPGFGKSKQMLGLSRPCSTSLSMLATPCRKGQAHD
jgi:hypothetical protein